MGLLEDCSIAEHMSEQNYVTFKRNALLSGKDPAWWRPREKIVGASLIVEQKAQNKR